MKNFKYLFTTLIISIFNINASSFDKANEQTVKGLDFFPRLKFGDLADDAGDGDFAGLAVTLAPVILFLVLFLLSVVLVIPWCCSRTCCKNNLCKCCCKRKKYGVKLTTIQKYGYLVALILFLLVIVAFAGIGYDANGRFSDAIVSEDDGLITNTENLAFDLWQFLNSTIYLPILFIKQHSISSINNISMTISSSKDLIVSGSENITDGLDDFEEEYGNKTLYVNDSGTGNTYSFPCSICTEIAVTVGDTSMLISNNTDPVIEELNATLTGITNTLIGVNDTMQDALGSVSDLIGNLVDSLEDLYENIEENRDTIEGFNDVRELAYNILFAIPLLPIIFVILGTLFKKSICFTVSYALSWFSCSIMWFMLLLHVPIVLVLNEGCLILDKYDEDPASEFGVNSTAGKVITSCLNDSRVADAFGVDKYLEFADIEFADINTSTITSAFTFDELSSFQDELANVSTDTFGSTVDNALDAVNELVAACSCGNSGDTFNRTTIDSLITTDYYTFNTTLEIELANLTNSTRTLIRVETASLSTFNNTIYDMRSDMNGIQDDVDSLEWSVNDFASKMTSMEHVLNPIIEKAEEIIDEGRCGFIADAYYDLKDNLCDGILGSLASMVICMLIIGIFSVFSCCYAVKMVRRINPTYRKDMQQNVVEMHGNSKMGMEL